MTMSAAVPARSPEEFEQVKQMATILYDKLMAQRDPNKLSFPFPPPPAPLSFFPR